MARAGDWRVLVRLTAGVLVIRSIPTECPFRKKVSHMDIMMHPSDWAMGSGMWMWTVLGLVLVVVAIVLITRTSKK